MGKDTEREKAIVASAQWQVASFWKKNQM